MITELFTVNNPIRPTMIGKTIIYICILIYCVGTESDKNIKPLNIASNSVIRNKIKSTLILTLDTSFIKIRSFEFMHNKKPTIVTSPTFTNGKLATVGFIST